MSVTIEGWERIQNFLNLFSSEVRKSGDELVELAAEMTANEARHLVPVRTGRLQRSIEVMRLGFMMWKAFSDLYYAGYVEFGTSRMHARPYFRPAWAMVEPRLTEALYSLIAQLLNRF